MPAPHDHGERTARTIGMLLLLASALTSLTLLVWGGCQVRTALVSFAQGMP